MSTTGSVYNLGRVTRLTSPHQDSYKFITPIFTTSYSAPHTYTQPKLVVPSLSNFTKLIQTLILPHTCLNQTCVSRLPQNILMCPTLGYLSSILQLWLSSTLPQNFTSDLFSCSCSPKSSPSLVVCPCALIGTPKVTNVKHHILWVCCTPS
jgi:hypothetical protein